MGVSEFLTRSRSHPSAVKNRSVCSEKRETTPEMERKNMKITTAIVAIAGIAAVANAGVTINEVLGSTTGSDTEFIELYNTTGASVDLTGWSIELWDSDADGTGFGGADGGAPYALAGSIAAGGYFTLANAQAQAFLSFTADITVGANSIENSSYTMILRDASNAVVESLFITDSVADVANIAGTPITPDFTVGPDGTFLPAGVYRLGDGAATFGILEFDQVPASATAGYANIPAPGALALLGLGGLATARRRR
jgi:MYXO-CTERM domain-containing protein